MSSIRKTLILTSLNLDSLRRHDPFHLSAQTDLAKKIIEEVDEKGQYKSPNSDLGLNDPKYIPAGRIRYVIYQCIEPHIMASTTEPGRLFLPFHEFYSLGKPFKLSADYSARE